MPLLVLDVWQIIIAYSTKNLSLLNLNLPKSYRLYGYNNDCYFCSFINRFRIFCIDYVENFIQLFLRMILLVLPYIFMMKIAKIIVLRAFIIYVCVCVCKFTFLKSIKCYQHCFYCIWRCLTSLLPVFIRLLSTTSTLLF